MVKNFKKHFEKSVVENPYLMMLVLRTTPLENGYSPAELLMGCKLRTNLSMTKKSIIPKIPEADDIRRELKYGVNQKKFYGKHNRVKDLQELEPGQVVWITDQRSYGRIKAKHAAPLSYLVETPRGIIRRNRFHLRPSSGQLEYDQDDTTRELPDFPRDSSPSKACCSSILLETPRGIIRRNRFHLRPSSGQLEYDQDDTTRELPDFPRDSSPVPLSDDVPGSPSLSHSSPTMPSTFNAPRSPEQFYRTRSGRTERRPMPPYLKPLQRPNRLDGHAGMALEFARRGEECNEIGFKFSPDYYLSTTVEYPVQKFSPTGYKIFPRRGAQHPLQGALPPLGPHSGATPVNMGVDGQCDLQTDLIYN
ncbi:hypothetical protein AVEN_249406-1 [Araneus ventricosus]|uniref:Uncharacterized protein n=1 Tax=Araneus ventricosus TaxID=182803 RepID=A0A4Y2RZA3_ARAVE|nr:hypothetical protein AVEN_249406-1 [Araneus ventricosus]